MRYVASTGGQEYHVEVERGGAGQAVRQVAVDGIPCEVDLESIDGGFHYSLLVGSASYEVFVERCEELCIVSVEGHRYPVRVAEERRGPGAPALGEASERALREPVETLIRSPMPGVVVAVLVRQGQTVHSGEGLLILEAMKMENEIRAPRSGVVEAVHVTPGQRVGQDDPLVLIGQRGAVDTGDTAAKPKP
jgi:biotin carboxyl carrier protein